MKTFENKAFRFELKYQVTKDGMKEEDSVIIYEDRIDQAIIKARSIIKEKHGCLSLWIKDIKVSNSIN